MLHDFTPTGNLIGQVAGLTEDSFPFDIMYTEQNSGVIFETDVGTSACLKALSNETKF